MSIESFTNIFAKQTDTNEIWSDGWPQNPQEFETLVDNIIDRLVWYAFRKLKNTDDAEDVVQEVLLKVYADRVKRSNVKKVVPYIYRMVANACLEHQRRNYKRPDQIEYVRLEDIPDETRYARQQTAMIEELEWIEKLLSQLPSKQAEVIRLRVIDDLPLVDIADITGCSMFTTKSRLYYGLRKLRQIIPDMEDDN